MLIVFTLRIRDDATLIRPISARYMRAKEIDYYEKEVAEAILFEFQPKSERVNMRLPKPLLDAVKASAAKAGVPINASFARC